MWVVMVVFATAAFVYGNSRGAQADPTCPDEDTNNSAATAQPYTSMVIGRSVCVAEADWYSFGVTEGDVVAVDAFRDGGTGEVDLTLYTTSGTQLQAATADGPTETLRHEVTATGTLRVKVFERGEDGEAQYTLAVRSVRNPDCGLFEDASEPNDERARATRLGSAPRQGFLCDGPDVFKVRVPASTPSLGATLTLNGQAGDLDLAIYDDTGTSLDVANGAGTTETVSVATPAAGIYFLEVYGFDGASGAYTLDADGVDDVASIEGHVWNRRDGDVAGITVDLHLASVAGVVASTTTAADGTYSFEAGTVSHGTYRIQFVDPAPAAYSDEWHLDAASHATAANIGLAPGQATQVDAQLASIIPYADFDDIPENDPLRPAVDWATFMGVSTGFFDNTFRPEDELTRADMVFWLWNLMEQPEPDSEGYFDDIQGEGFAHEAINWAAGKDIVTGFETENGYWFQPEDEALRQDVIQWIYNTAGEPDTAGMNPHGYSDIPTDATYEDALTWAQHHGLVTPSTPPDEFGPELAIERGDGADWLHKWAQVAAAWDQVPPIPTTVLF